MIDIRTLNLVGLVSQTTFALTVSLLAWSDRRSRGMVWLALASLSLLLAMTFRLLVPGDPRHFSEAMGSSLVLLIFFCVFRGLQWFVVRRERSRSWMPLFVCASIAAVSFVSIPSPDVARTLARIFVACILVVTIKMAWTTRFRSLRLAARVCAVQMAAMGSTMLFRVYIDEFSGWSMHPRADLFSREAALVVIPAMSLAFISLFIAEQKRRVHEETRTDALTGLYNRRAMEECATRAISSARQHDRALSLLMLDVDNFKILNDTWGHWLGDRALHALGSVLLTGTGTDDITARMGGEEFAVLLPGRDMGAAILVAERLRSAVEDLRLNEEECTAHLTVSIGISVLCVGEKSWSDMLRRADKALYRAKREGRNRVVQYCDDVTPTESLDMDHAHVFRGPGVLLTGTEGSGWTN